MDSPRRPPNPTDDDDAPDIVISLRSCRGYLALDRHQFIVVRPPRGLRQRFMAWVNPDTQLIARGNVLYIPTGDRVVLPNGLEVCDPTQPTIALLTTGGSGRLTAATEQEIVTRWAAEYEPTLGASSDEETQTQPTTH